MARKQLGAPASGDTDIPVYADLSKVVANVQTASYTLVLSDKGKAVEMNAAAAVTVTVPVSTSVAFPLGTILEVLQYGAGQVTLVGASGVSVKPPITITTRAQYSALSLRYRGGDEWVVGGDMT